MPSEPRAAELRLPEHGAGGDHRLGRHETRLAPDNLGDFLWTGGNQWQIALARKPRKQAETVAVGCDRLPRAAHGKEGVDRAKAVSETLAHNWRSPVDLQLLQRESRLCEPALSRPERQRRAPAQPVFHLGDRNELQASAADPT
jgi:hypothetical protein